MAAKTKVSIQIAETKLMHCNNEALENYNISGSTDFRLDTKQATGLLE